MKKFHTGDRVRVISERNMEGTVTGRDKHGNVLVEMSDGFGQAFPDRELALVNSSAEAAAFSGPVAAAARTRMLNPFQSGPAKAAEAQTATAGPSIGRPDPAQPARKGIFLGLSAQVAGTNARELVLLNNSDLHLALVVGYNREGRYQTEKVALAPAKQATPLMEVPARFLQDRPTFQVWAYASAPGLTAHPAPLHTAWQLPADYMDRPLEPAPVTGRPMLFTELETSATPKASSEPGKLIGALPGGKLVQTGNQEARGERPDAGRDAVTGKAIADAMMAPKAPAAPPAPTRSNASDELDLSIGNLSPKAAQLSPEEMLQTQLRAFEEAFEQALGTGAQYLTLMHGTGSPALRNAIHRRLSAAAQNGLIGHFEDTQKDRFGYAATRVKFF